MAKRKVSNPLALAVMSYLTTGPMHRYELVRTLRANGDSRSVKFTPASVYMVVDQLEKAGFIEEHETLRTGGYPERVTYVLTDGGRAEWREWLRNLIANPDHEYLSDRATARPLIPVRAAPSPGGNGGSCDAW
jgi:DNA-binding PadR family transcriptional regulator